MADARWWEQLTRVSPLVINGVGLVFFQLVYWGLLAARGEPRRVPPIIGNVLLGGPCRGSVLTGFQYLIAQTFCSYCLVIFGFVVLLNFVLGIRQVVAGILIFAATALAFASLDLTRNHPRKTGLQHRCLCPASRPDHLSEASSVLTPRTAPIARG
jgi:hypothetical protein